jgi:hypothetical protein
MLYVRNDGGGGFGFWLSWRTDYIITVRTVVATTRERVTSWGYVYV